MIRSRPNGVCASPLPKRGADDAALQRLVELARAVEQSPASVVITDPRGNIEYVNPKFEKVSGYSYAEAVGQNPRVLKSGRQSGEFYKDLWETILAGETWRGELENRRKDGTSYWELASISPIRDDAGEVIAFVAVKEDITERRRIREELKQALVRAEEAARVKAAFLANMSHEIRTPLNGIIGLASLLEDMVEGEQAQQYLETLKGCGDALLTLINDVLDISKIEAGEVALEHIELEPRAVAESVGDLLGVRAQQKGLELVVMVHHRVPEQVKGDPHRLRQVLINLVGNAIKFTDTGEIVVEVDAEPDDAAPDQVALRFSVRDTGIGIDAAAQERLFEAFTQADASTTRKYGGTGLGLAISSQLVQIMGGDLQADSVVGEGTTFFFVAPFERSADETVKREASCASKSAHTTAQSLADKRVLLVDDNATNRMVLSEMLRRWGCQVIEASGGADALGIVDGDAAPAIDLVLVDFQMPQMDGFELSQRLRTRTQLSSTPIGMLTSAPASETERASQQRGLDAYLTKPVKREVLQRACCRLIEGASQADSVRSRRRVTLTERVISKQLEAEKHRVLVVEDNAVNRVVVVRTLDKAGYVVDVATDGVEALEAVAARDYDAVLMDCQMPRLDGWQATRQIRADERGANRHLPIIAFTASAQEQDERACVEAGMDGFICKPVRPAVLLEALAQHLERER